MVDSVRKHFSVSSACLTKTNAGRTWQCQLRDFCYFPTQFLAYLWCKPVRSQSKKVEKVKKNHFSEMKGCTDVMLRNRRGKGDAYTEAGSP